ncbi:hypothetical protein IWW48_003213 [Coemansia sp. RSA 1200]|nr:hypothetical protein IWW48_003213 [Coemansia sp. RSA 1200]
MGYGRRQSFSGHTRAHSRSRSPSKNEGHGTEQRKHSDRGKRPDGFSTITQDDFFILNAAFRLWLHKEKDRYFDEMTTIKARKHFGSFVRAWNSGRLRSRYYSQDAGLGALPKRDVTRYSWKFAAKLDGRDQLEETVEEVHKSNAPRSSSGSGERHPAAESSAQPPRQGPTMPSLEERPAASGRVFDEEQRDRDRRRRKREQREAREREQLILDEVAPRETGREAMIAKRRALHSLRHAEKAATADAELSDSELFGDGASDLAALKRDRAHREKRRLERQQEARAESGRSQRQQERQDKERSTVQMLQALAQQSRELGLGMMAQTHPPPEPRR